MAHVAPTPGPPHVRCAWRVGNLPFRRAARAFSRSSVSSGTWCEAPRCAGKGEPDATSRDATVRQPEGPWEATLEYTVWPVACEGPGTHPARAEGEKWTMRGGWITLRTMDHRHVPCALCGAEHSCPESLALAYAGRRVTRWCESCRQFFDV